MNEKILNSDGTITAVGDAGSVSGIIADRVRRATIPAIRDMDGNVQTPAIVPSADDVAVEITEVELKTHSWRLPKARESRLEDIRSLRDAKLEALDTEYIRALEGSHPGGRTTVDVAAVKQALRDLPPFAEIALAAMNNTDEMEAYLPGELR